MARLAFACVTSHAFFFSTSARHLVRKGIAPALLAVGAAILAPTGAQANSAKGEAAPQQIRVATANLNLLSSPPRKPTKTTRPVRQVGSGSYICSAAGFGQRSRCYAN